MIRMTSETCRRAFPDVRGDKLRCHPVHAEERPLSAARKARLEREWTGAAAGRVAKGFGTASKEYLWRSTGEGGRG